MPTIDVNGAVSGITTTLRTLTLSKLIPGLLVLIFCLASQKMFQRLFEKALRLSKVDRNLHGFLRSTAKFSFYLLTILLVAETLGIQLTSLVALLSVAGLAVSLSIQGTLSNLAGGIMLLVSKPFAVGDYIDAGDTSGVVSEIGLVYTQLMSIDNKKIYIPNSQIAAARITNYSAEQNRRIEIVIGASYDAPIAAVKEALCAVAARHPEVLSDPPVFCNVVAYRDSCIEYTLRVWVPTPLYWDIYFAMLEEVKEEFDRRDIEMTYPHVNVHLDTKPQHS